ncbi:MAG: cadmium-translocating P-type ATPase [Treponema sp.]|nr:cadmium-translocating P-type ATPase [Treponema sp.]
MEGLTKTEFILEGLCCPVCAGKIERSVSALKGVKSAAVDLVNRRLVVEMNGAVAASRLAAQAGSLVRRLEPSIVMLSPPADGIQPKAAETRRRRLSRIGMGAGAVLFVLGMTGGFSGRAEFTLFLASYLLIGGEVLMRALKNIARGKIFDENFLMSLATVGAFAIGEYPEGAAVMLFYQIGEAFQEYAVGRSQKSISALLDIRPDYANLQTGSESRKVSPETVSVGDHIIVRPGEKVPLDGIVTEGRSALDASALTGESLPRDVEPGSEVLSGSINTSGLLTVRVTKRFGESTVSKILDLVRNAGRGKAPVENFITKFARYYTPAVVVCAVLLACVPPLVLPDAQFSQWLGRALVFLVVSCPCALVISIPLSFFGGIGGASRNGILVKGGNYLDALTSVDTVVFDKTGTLTQGVFTLTELVPAAGVTKEELLYYAAHAERNSSHPIAVSIQKAYRAAGGEFFPEKIAGCEELAGQGVRLLMDGRRVLAGNGRLLDEAGIAHPAPEALGSLVYLALDGAYAGYLVIADELKRDSKAAVAALRALGVRRIAMLTGDAQAVAARVAGEAGVDVFYAGLLPHQKVEKLLELEKAVSGKGKLVFAGDGINDAPVLARAGVGIAMGGAGSDAAIEAADVVLMTDEPSKIAGAIVIARKTRRIVRQNIIFALGVKAVILVLGALGIATMWEAVFGDVGVAVIAILNAMRAMRVTLGKGQVGQRRI